MAKDIFESFKLPNKSETFHMTIQFICMIICSLLTPSNPPASTVNQLWACALFCLIHCQTAPASTYLADQIWLEIRRLSHQDRPTKYMAMRIVWRRLCSTSGFQHKISFSRSVELCVVYSYFCGYGTILREMAEHFWFCTEQREIVFYIRPFRVEMTDIQTHIFVLKHTQQMFYFWWKKNFFPSMPFVQCNDPAFWSHF